MENESLSTQNLTAGSTSQPIATPLILQTPNVPEDPPKRRPIRLIIFAVLALFLIIGLLIGGYFLGRFKTQTPSNPPKDSGVYNDTPTPKSKTERISSINAGWKIFEAENISIDYPSDYKAEEREKGFYVILKDENKTLGEAEINIDSRRQNANADYDQAITTARNNLEKPVEKEISNGVKMYGEIKEGLGKGTPTLYALIKYGNGALVIEHSGKILNEPVFDQVVSSITIN